MTRHTDGGAPGVPVEVAPDKLLPGASVHHGRYRLLERVGSDSRVAATCWRARDSVLDRDVAVTTLTGPDGPRVVRAALATARLGHPGVARLLDGVSDVRALGPGLTGLVVTEWLPGADLATLAVEAARTDRAVPSSAIARATSELASAVDAAHRAGIELGCDHPQRIRVGGDGVGRLQFPVGSATGEPSDDVRGIGACLYLLLTGRWPLPDPPAGLPAAPTRPDGSPVSPHLVRPGVSATLSTLADRCLVGAAANGVHSGAAVYLLLDQVTNAEADTTLLAPVPAEQHERQWADGLAYQPQYDDDEDDVEPDRARGRKALIGFGVLVVAILVMLGWLASTVIGFLSDGPSTGGPSVVVPKPGEQSAAAEPGQPQPTGQPAPPVATGPVQAAGAEVFNIAGDPDNPNRVTRAVDGNPGTSWKTFDYNQPFPTLKPGVGVLVQFVEPVTLASVQIDSPSAGAVVEVRTPPAGDAGVSGSTVLGTGQLAAGRTEIQLAAAPPGQQVLIWITTLSTATGKNAVEFSELTFQRAG